MKSRLSPQAVLVVGLSLCALAGCASRSLHFQGFDDIQLDPRERAAVEQSLATTRNERLFTVRLAEEWRTVSVSDRWIDDAGLHCRRWNVQGGGIDPLSYDATDPSVIATYRWLRSVLAKSQNDLVTGRPERKMVWHLIPDQHSEVAMNRRAHGGPIAWIVNAATASSPSNAVPWEAQHSWDDVFGEPPSDVYVHTILLDLFDDYVARIPGGGD